MAGSALKMLRSVVSVRIWVSEVLPMIEDGQDKNHLSNSETQVHRTGLDMYKDVETAG